MNVIDSFKKTRGRPKGSGTMTLRKYADNPQALTLPKTEQQQVKELKDLLIKSAGANVVHKAVEIAMNDEHPAQMAAIKLCMDRMLPVSLFEKEGKQRSAVNITISGIGGYFFIRTLKYSRIVVLMIFLYCNSVIIIFILTFLHKKNLT